MAIPLQRPPGPSDSKNPRAGEYFLAKVHDMLKLVGTRTLDVPSISAGGVQTFTITVDGCRADRNQTVEIGLPSTFNTNLVPWAYVSADNTVTVVIRNPTGGPIDPGSATYGVRVTP